VSNIRIIIIYTCTQHWPGGWRVAGGWAVDQYYYDYYSGSYYSVRERERELLVVAFHRYTHTHVYTYYMPCCLSSLKPEPRFAKCLKEDGGKGLRWETGVEEIPLWACGGEGGGEVFGSATLAGHSVALHYSEQLYTYIETRRRSSSRVSWAGGIILYGVCQSDEKSATVTMKLPTDLTLRSGSNNNDNSQFSHNHNHKFRTCPAIV
jgi:hypothetical protein